MPNGIDSHAQFEGPRISPTKKEAPAWNPQQVSRVMDESLAAQRRDGSAKTTSLATLMNMFDSQFASSGMQESMGIGGLQKYIGITEGSDPDKIKEFHAAAGLTAGPETPWCMSFVQYVLRHDMGLTDAQIGPPTASAADGLNIGQIVSTPSPGDIVVVPGEGPSGKHIGICSAPGKYISGNTGNKVAEKPIPGGAEYRHVGGANMPEGSRQMMA